MSNSFDKVTKDIFFTHPISIDLLRVFPYMIFMDFTYKTNKYKLMLIEIIRVTSTYRIFYIACAYLEFERDDNCHWVLVRLKALIDENIMPNIVIQT